jgi:hypothetical protein
VATENSVSATFDDDFVAEKVAVPLSSQSCAIERSEPEARSGKIWAVHASAEKEGNWRVAVWLECMMPLLGTRTEMLELAGRLFVHGRLVVM